MYDKLAALALKYNDMTVLRRRRDAVEASGEAFSDAELDERRVAFKDLARRFPGSLRELEQISTAEIEAKAAAVVEEMRSGGPIGRQWVRVVIDFHETLARLLASKMALARGEPVADDAVRRPPGGRLVTLVWRELESRHGVPRAELEALVFGPQE